MCEPGKGRWGLRKGGDKLYNRGKVAGKDTEVIGVSSRKGADRLHERGKEGREYLS